MRLSFNTNGVLNYRDFDDASHNKRGKEKRGKKEGGKKKNMQKTKARMKGVAGTLN